ncbi:NAD-dependent epimerase/dehydratase family protein [Phreatobacter cathodiphilus]|nr:NAD-dependent epimerase/dehydratase family protein [Phreatobacter cathodiphilus]
MTILVTGAGGFLGAALVEALAARGFAVRAAARSPLPALPAGRVSPATLPDLAGSGLDDRFSALLEGVEAVVHAAGLAHRPAGLDETVMQAVNAHASASLARAARRRGVGRFVLISSSRAVSGPSSPHPLTETATPAPSDAYGRSKLAAERTVREELPEAIILRPPVLHGAGAKGNMARLARLARSPLPLPFGGLAGRRSILSDANVAEAVAFVLARPDAAGRTFHLADGDPLTVGQMIGAMRQAVGRPPGIVGLPAALTERLVTRLAPALADQLCRDLILDDAAIRALGWRPVESSAAGLGRMMRG